MTNGFTKEIDGYWATTQVQLDDTWLPIEKEDGAITAPQGLVEQLANEQLEQAKANLVSTVDAYIQITVDAYNKANGTLFASVHNCATYINVPTYIHYEFCVDVVKFNADVWEKARAIEADVLAGLRPMPTAKKLVVELPVFEG